MTSRPLLQASDGDTIKATRIASSVQCSINGMVIVMGVGVGVIGVVEVVIRAIIGESRRTYSKYDGVVIA